MVREASQNFKDLVASFKDIIENELPPDDVGERRRCIIEIKDMLGKKEKKLHNGAELNS